MKLLRTVKQGVTRPQIKNIMPDEIRATKTVNEARAVVDAMPLSKENLMDHEYIPVGPLMPLTALIGGGQARQ